MPEMIVVQVKYDRARETHPSQRSHPLGTIVDVNDIEPAKAAD